MFGNSRPMASNMTREESKALKYLKYDREIIILQADKGNCTVVLNE
jgi:hypothetical protein